MEKIIETLIKKLFECAEWTQISPVFESQLLPLSETIQFFLEILKEFSINDPEIKDIIEQNLDSFLEQMKIVCYHIISTFYISEIRITKTTDFFTIHVKWFYVIFVYFSLKRMVCKEIIVWPNFRENQNIQKMFIDNLIKYERTLPIGYYSRGLCPNFSILLTYITSSPSCMLEGIGGMPDYME
jgi:hypothetical protein